MGCTIGHHEYIFIQSFCNQRKNQRTFSTAKWPTVPLQFFGGGGKPENPVETHVNKVSICKTPHRQEPKLRIEAENLELWCGNRPVPWPIIYCIFGFLVIKKTKVWSMLKSQFQAKHASRDQERLKLKVILKLSNFDSRNDDLVLFLFKASTHI